jgi:hypothetical protein
MLIAEGDIGGWRMDVSISIELDPARDHCRRGVDVERRPGVSDEN